MDRNTPYQEIDLRSIHKSFVSMRESFSNFADIYYAVKANPDHSVLSVLANGGCSFDIASRYELDKVLSLPGMSADRVSFGNTIKKTEDIAYFYNKGVYLYATDSIVDLEKIAKAAPGSRVYCRILLDEDCFKSAGWPLSRKFGCTEEMAFDILSKAKDLGLEPYGISFHVGSQQSDISIWGKAMLSVSRVCSRLSSEKDIQIDMVNLGGGFSSYNLSGNVPVFTIGECADYLKSMAKKLLPGVSRFIIEPGRGLVADSGTLHSSVIMVSDKGCGPRWAYIDCGKFGGLIETLDECIHYIIDFDDKESDLEPFILAGPTCDSMDVLYEKQMVMLPKSLKEGDVLRFLGTGAYTTSYSAVEFNGFPPLRTVISK